MDAAVSPVPTDLQGRAILSLPAANSLAFLRAVFDCWESRQLFAITRSPDALDGLGLPVETGVLEDSDEPGGWGRFSHQPRFSDEPAQITFSSGTEGRPKAILISHRNLADVVQRLNAAMGVTDEIREYIGVPVTYSFGLGRARAVAAAGGAFFLPERFDPGQIRDMLAEGQINAISAVPSLWRLVLAQPEVIGALGQKVRWIEIGSQYMSVSDKLAMRALFPNARIIQHYGLTEASRSTFLDLADTSEDALESVGTAQGTVELKITAEGAIAIRGDHVALGLVGDGGTVRPLTDDQGWLLTRDRGEIRDGRLYYLGRLDDQINLAGVKMGAEGIEAQIRELVPGASGHFAVAPVPDDARGEAVLLVIEERAGDLAALIEEAARTSLTRRGVKVGTGQNAALKVMRLADLPRTGTDKVQRNLLPGLWRAAQDSAADPADLAADLTSLDLSPDQARLAEIWARVVGAAQLTPQTSFYDAGGDSLSSVQIGLVMEKAGLPRKVIRATLEGRTLAEAAALMEDSPAEDALAAPAQDLTDGARRSWAITMTRAIMALSVLISHWAPGVLGRLGLSSSVDGALSLVYRAGTPGFAAVFGIGIGYFMLPGFASKRASVLRRLQGSFHLVLIGLVLLGLIYVANAAARGRELGAGQIATSFYGVLAYYAVMLGTARWWLPALARVANPIPWLLGALPVLWMTWHGAAFLLPAEPLETLLEWPRLMLVAVYNVFKMSALAAAGVAIGLWLSRQKDSAQAAEILILGGALGIALNVLTLIEVYGAEALTQRLHPAFISLPGLLIYVSAAAFFVGVFLRILLAWSRLGSVIRLPLQILLVIGALALPIYVFHGLVIPGMSLLNVAGLPRGFALAISMGGFLLVVGYSGRRLWRMYFS